MEEFEEKHHNEFGFIMKNKCYTVEFCRLRVTFSMERTNEEWIDHPAEPIERFFRRTDKVYFEHGFLDTPFYTLDAMTNCQLKGPAVLVAQTFSVLVCPGWKAHVLNQDVLLVLE